MIKLNNKKDCCGCSACANICPKNCIDMVSDSEGFLYPDVCTEKCIDCNLCVKSCPIINQRSLNRTPIAYGGWNKNENIRKNSSSGGIFSLLCEYIIANNGVVFGAAFNENFDVVHSCSETFEGCEVFRGSKYVQSVIGDNYKSAKEFLDNGRMVLFTGTPCQIAGLYSYLKKDYDNLLTQDIVCHSVPSPKIWNEYKALISSGKDINNIQFRNKDTGWLNGKFIAELSDDSKVSKPYGETVYIKGFLNGLYSRPSCHDCKFSSLSRVSDITLGDFWGVDSFYPELFDNKGTSLVFVNSERGERVLKNIKKKIKIKKVSLEKAIWYNPAINTVSYVNPNRKSFFEDISDLDVKYKKYEYKFNNQTKTYSFSIVDKLKLKLSGLIKK